MRDKVRYGQLQKAFAYALISYGAIGLPGTFFSVKHLVGIVIDSTRTGSTWPFFQNWGLHAVVGSSFRVLSVWGALTFGFLMIRRPKALAPALIFLGFCSLIPGICGYLVPNRGLSSLTLFQHVTVFSNSFSLSIAFFIAAVAVWRPGRTLQSTEHAKLACSQCGYDMRGLAEPRCPECGRVYTLDEFHGL